MPTGIFPRPPANERFWAKVEKTETCWLWQGALGRGGYGNFSATKRSTINAHRFAYESLIGPIPEGLVLDHLCRVRRCVNPQHLRVVSPRINVLAGVALSAQNARKDRCQHGHPFDEANTRYYLTKRGLTRQCRACHREYERDRRARLKYPTPKVEP